MRLGTIRSWIILVLVAASSIFSIDTCKAQGLPSVRSFTDVAAPIRYKALHLDRKSIAGPGATRVFLNEWDSAESVEVMGSSGRWYWRQSEMSSGSRYLEAFIWDEMGRNAYLGYASLSGDITGAKSSCSANDTSGCAFVVPEGQVWIKNYSASASQASDLSPSIETFSSSTTGSARGHRYYDQARNPVAFIHYVLFGQVWARRNFDNSLLRSYADHVNTAETLGWADPGTSARTDVILEPASAYIVRQYSDCPAPDATGVALVAPSDPSGPPYHMCRLFEDHVYGMDKTGAAMGQIGFVFGFTPAAFGWADRHWAVTHMMLMKQKL